MNEHPTAAELRSFLEGQLAPERRRAIITHLLQGCKVCSPIAGNAFGYLPVNPMEYDAVTTKVFKRFSRAMKRERERAREVVDHLEQGELSTLRRRFHGLALFEELLARSWALRHENPGKMIELARHATLVARALDTNTYGRKLVSDLQCRAWADLGNAYRVAEDLEEAEHAFCRAEAFFDQGTHDEMLQARLLDLRASYYGDRREFEMSFAALDTAIAIYSRYGNQHLVGRALVTKGLHASYKGETDAGVLMIREGLALIEPERDPSLYFAAVHNLARGLMEQGQLREARKVLSRNIWRQGEAGGSLNLLKLSWLEAQISAELRETRRAEQGYLRVIKGFTDFKKFYHAAVASLDLATLYLQQERAEEAKVASLEALEIFRAAPLHHEGLGAMLLLLKSFQMGKATADLVKSVAEYLRRAQNNPTAKFEPPGE